MTLDDLRELSAVQFAEHHVYFPLRRPPEAPKKDDSYRHILYPVSRLGDLIDKLRAFDEFEDPDHKYSVRYLVTEAHQILFALEGKPGREIPAHSSISPSCLAAGNMFFSEDYRNVIAINHQSGDFEPRAGSLVWPLAILLNTDVPLARSVEVRTLVNREPLEEVSFEASPEELGAILPAEVNVAALIEANTPDLPVIKEYVDPRSVVGSRRRRDEDEVDYPRPALRARSLFSRAALPATEGEISNDVVARLF